MQDFDILFALAQACGQLHVATGVARGDDGRAGALDMAQFAREQLCRHFRLGDIVDARAAAAPVRLRQFLQLQPGYALEQFARLGCDFLSVAEVAGLVISHRAVEMQGCVGLAQIDFNEPFTDVFDFA